MKKRILSILLALVMVLGMLPVTAMAADSYTFTTDDAYKGTSNNTSTVISECVITGASVLKHEITDNGDKGQIWDVYLSADTALSAELTYTLTVKNNKASSAIFLKNAKAKHNDGEYGSPTQENSKYTHTFNGVPVWNSGKATETFTVAYLGRDSWARTYTLNLHIDNGVNDAPVLTGESSAAKTMRVNETYELDLSGIFMDPEGKTLSYWVSINGADPIAAAASYSYVPKEAGTHTLVFTASDGELTSAPYTVTLTVNNNVPPALTGDATLAATAIQAQTWNLDLSTVFADAEGDDMTYTVAIDGADPVDADAAYSFVPSEVRDYILVFQATDNLGASSPAYTVTLTATANPGPVLVGDSTLSADAMHGLPWTLDLTKVFVDNEGDPITYAVSVAGADAVAANSSYSYTPAAAGTTELVFQAVDGKGATSPTYTVTLNVAENPVPTLTGDASAEFSATQYSAWTLDVSEIFTDNDGDSLTYTVAINGADAVSAPASYSYTPNALGPQTLVFRAIDLAENQSAAYTVTLNVSEPDMSNGVWINHSSANGSLNYVKFTDTNGQAIEGLEASIDGEAITVSLPTGFAADGKVRATFNLTQTANNEPFVSTKSAATGTSANKAVNNKFTSKDITLSNGSVTFTFYYFNAAPSATNNQGRTDYTISIKVKNELPKLAEGAASTDTQTITAGEGSYSVDLSQLFTDPEGQDLTYQVSINDADYVACDASYTYSNTVAGTYILKFRATDGQDVSEDLYTVTLNVRSSADTYTVPVTVPDTVEGLTFYGDSLTGETLTYENGSVYIPKNVTNLWWKTGSGMSASVAVSEETTALTLQLTTFTVKTAAGEADTAATVTVTNPNGTTPTAKDYTYLLASGSGYTYAITPGSSSWNAVSVTELTVTEELTAEIPVALTLKNAKTITVPKDAQVHVYSQNGYTDGNGRDTEIAATYSAPNADGTVTYYYSIGSANYGAGYSYVAFYEDLISYAGYFNDVTDVVLSWDEETRKPSYRGDYDLSTIFGARGDDSVVTNVNSNGHLVLNTGSEFMLKAYRSWQIINSDTTNVMIEPEFNYETSNDNVTITPYNERNTGVSGTSSNNWVYVKANASGTTYLEIGYDAVHIVDGYASGTSGGAQGQPSNFTWNASDPGRTALIVVQTDGNAASGVKFGIQSPSGAWDYEYDTVYFTESQGSLTMIPTASGGIGSVAVSHDKGESYTTLTGTDGTYTVPVVDGNNIIRITDGSGKTAYQVVRGAQVSYTIANVTEGKASTDEIVPGDTIRITFSTMHAVCPKISGIYNPGYPASNQLNYKQNDTAVVQRIGYQYDFHNNVWIEVTAGNANIELTGGYMNTPIAAGSAIGALYDAAAVNSGGSGSTSRNILPDITIPVSGIVDIPATAVTLSSQSVTLGVGGMATLTATVTPENSTDTVSWSSSNEAVATVDKNGVVTAVSAGSATITATAGNVSASCAVTVTAEQAGLIEIKTPYANPEEVLAATLGLSNIKISGAEAAGKVTGDDPNWSVELAAGSGDSLTVTLQGVLGPLVEGNISNWYFWVNGVLSENAMGSYDDYIYSTTITPEWKDGTTVLTLGVGTASEIKTSYTVTLTRAEEIAVSGISLAETATVVVGETLTLEATVTPDNATNKTVTWESSDKTIATVDSNGVVTGVKAGNVTITATAGGHSAECAVEVKVPAVPATGITLNREAAELKEGRKLALTATMTPENTTETPVWTSSNENIATVANGIVTAVAEGTATITATVGEFSDSCTVTVVEDPDTDGKATVYFSVSDDAAFVKTDKGIVAALQKLDVPYFDLALYGLEAYKLEETDPGYGKPTMLHLYIYATEILQCGIEAEDAGKGYLKDNNLMGTALFKMGGAPGSVFMESFWNLSENLNYYHNYLYPAESDGWGITADRVVLSDGDIVTIGHFSFMNFYADASSIFNYIVAGEDTVMTSAVQDQTLTLNLYRAGANMGNGGSNTAVKAAVEIRYVKADAMTSGDVTSWNTLGTTDENGQLQVDLSKLAPGQYVLALAGRKGTTYTDKIVSTPGGILLTVLESEASKQVKKVIGLIDEIGDTDKITLDSESAIVAARNAYDALSDEQKAAVTNYSVLENAEAKLAELQQAKADQDAADAATAKINAVGTVTRDSKAVIDEARAAYDALTDAQKKLVSEETLKKLTDAEAAYAKLVADEADQAAAKTVEEKIAAIGTVTLDSENAIQEAWSAYDALTDVQKALVPNIGDLISAEQKLAVLKDEAAANAVEDLINAIGSVTLDSEDAIQAAREAYDKLTGTQKARVENYAVLTAAEETLELLKLSNADILSIYQTTGNYLVGLAAPTVGTTNGEWRVIGLSRSGHAVAASYYDAVVEYVKNNIDENGRLHEAKSTDNSRIIVALTAIGKDVTDVGGYDLLSGLNDMEYIGNQGINGTIWALIAFDTHNYEIPAGDVTREKLVEEILNAQLAGGGWALSGTVGDPDMTGMALQALAPYYSTESNVKSAVDKALTWLSGIQNKDGTFSGSEGTTSESLSQVITGLTALGINPETDSRFVKNGVSAMDALSRFYVEGGGFKHGLTGDRNMMATEQGYYALVSYYRLLQGKNSLYDMSDVTIQTAAKDQEAADAVEALIDAIGTVMKDSGEKIQAARDAYDALTDAQKALVENYKTLTEAETKYAELVKTAEDEAAAKAVEDQIDAVGTVTLDSESKIVNARKAYDALTDIQKALVSNYDVLTASEQKLLDLKDEAVADAVEKLISAIGTVTLDSEDKIIAARKAYDALTEAQKKYVDNYRLLTNAESKLNELKSTVSVTFTLLGCSRHGTDKVHTLAGGNLSTWIGTKTYMVAPGATVKDVLEKALTEAGMTCSNPTGNYVESINGIGEFTNGSNSGWMYTLNGTHPNLGVAEQTVKNGDVIVFHYTDDYTKEDGSQGYGDRDEEAAEKIEKLIDAIGTVTLNSADEIAAARKAYDALTYTQKELVDNYATLTAAEAKYTELKAADDEKKADTVEYLIDAIMEGSSTFEDDVNAAQKAYNNLTADQKKLVNNYYKLAGYLKELADEEDKEAAEAVEKLIKDLGTITLESEEDIKAARVAYDKLTDEQKALVENLAVLEAAEERLAELKALAGVEDIYKTTGDYLADLGTPVPGSVGGEWMVIGLIRSDREVPGADDYYESVVRFVQENIDKNERLHSAKSSENSRMILALTALGKDVTDVGGHNLLMGLNSIEFIQKQGINGPIWALIAFDSGNYPTPEGDVTRETLLQIILDAQLADGGWALSGETSDADMTGMAVQALAPYYKSNTDVKKALDEAIQTLSKMQAADGSYGSIDGTSSESVAQVIVALAALGIDADKDTRFIKNGISAVDALCAFYVEGGGFKHLVDGNLDGMATEQGYYALTAYFRMLDDKTSLYNMTDVMDMGGDVETVEPTETLPAETEPAPTEPVPTGENKGGFPWWLVIVIVVLAGAIVVLLFIAKPKKGKHEK